jgi:DNA-binding NtrC family response regulator
VRVTERLRILLVDEDAAARRAIGSHLARSDDEVELADDGRAAYALLAARTYDLVVGDVRSPRVDVGTLCDAVRARSPRAAVVAMSAFASVEHVTAAMRQGVYDYLLKPVEAQHVAALLVRVRERIVLRRRIEALRDARAAREALAALMTGGPSMTALSLALRSAAASDDPVLVVGEAGTGRRLVAQAIHALSLRAEMPLVAVNCALEPSRVQAIMFGPASAHGGLVAAARGGTLVLESVTSLPQELRVRTLHAASLPGAARVIAVSEGFPVGAGRREGRRGELLAWVRAVEVITPPLRERREDIPHLAEHFAVLAAGPSARAPRVAPDAMAALLAAPWAGNLRELEGVMREAVARAAGSDAITREHLPASLALAADESPLVAQVEAYERALVRRALERVNGAVARAARELGVPERTLRRKMRHFNIAKEAFRARSRYKHLPTMPPRP